MKISQAIKYLSDYEDHEQELMISWNDRATLEEGDQQIINESYERKSDENNN